MRPANAPPPRRAPSPGERQRSRRAGPSGGLTDPNIKAAPTVGNAPQWKPIGVIPEEDQIGRYAIPPLTQQGANWPGVQLKCGVEGFNSRWMVQGFGDRPYYQQTQYPSKPARLQMVGGRPGKSGGAATVSAMLGPQRRARATAMRKLAAGILGW